MAPPCSASSIPLPKGPTTLPAGTRLRVVAQPIQTAAEGDTLVAVEGVDDPSIHGFMRAADLAAKDSSAPIVRVLDPGGPFSPNGDASRDAASIRGRFTESVDWTLRVRNGSGTTLFETTGTGSDFTVGWDGKVGGKSVADGTYAVSVSGNDAWVNGPASATRTLVVDTEAPALEDLSPGSDANLWFSPNGDGVRDTASLTATNAETGALVTRITAGGGAVVKTWTVPNGSAAETITWNGKVSGGATAPDGIYTVAVAPQDRAGNTGGFIGREVKVIGALRSVLTSRTLFFPQDLDTLDKATMLSFTLARPMTVDWTLRNAAGEVVVTRLDDVALPAGTHSWRFAGTDADGAMLPRGRYTSTVVASDGTLIASQSVSFDTDAFRFKVSDTTPKRGQKISVTISSAEVLAQDLALLCLPARCRSVERGHHQGLGAHLQGHLQAQVERRGRYREVQGQRSRHQGRLAIHDGDAPDPLRRDRAGRRGPTLARSANCTGPHRTAPYHPGPGPSCDIRSRRRRPVFEASESPWRTAASMPTHHPPARLVASARSRTIALAASLLMLVAALPVTLTVAAEPKSAPPAGGPGLRPTIQYEEAMAHADDTTTFVAGDRVTVPFKPRVSDRWPVGGVTPRALPAGRVSGQAMRAAPTPQRPIKPTKPTDAAPVVAVSPVDLPYLDPTTSFVAQPAAAVDPGGLKREVFGFLPYWELSDSSTRFDWEKLSTIAYFGVGASGAGNLQKRNSDGSTTVGWSGWTSSRMTSVINAAHASGARVVLTVQSFAWSSAGVARQKSLLGSAGNRANLARQIAAAVRDRGADGVNLDFEPIVATYADEFTSLVRAVRSELNKVHAGYQLTFDTTGWIGNYPIEKATARGRRGRGRDHGLRLPQRVIQPGRIDRAHRRTDLRHRRHGQGLHRADPCLEDHPGRAVLRPRLVDGLVGAPRAEHLGNQVRRLDDGRVWHGPPIRRGIRQAARPGRGRGVDRLQAQELHRQVRLRDPLAPDLLRRCEGARAEVRPDQPERAARGRHLGARL